jgi:4-amino-4-deoxy-L-arabinose transferase-like glycosyltransferase
VASFAAHRIGLSVVLAAYLALAAWYNLTVPIFETPDEIWHYLYVRHLSEGRGLPRDEGRNQGLLSQQEGAQPPLYYAFAAALTFWAPRGDLQTIVRPNRVGHLGDPGGQGNRNMFLHGPAEAFPWHGETLTVHLVRLTTTLWGALAVVCAYLIGKRTFSSAWLAVAAAAVVAFTPEFLFMSAAVNNDVAVAGAMGVLLWLAIRTAQNKPSRSQSFVLGLVAGAVILVKPLAAGGLVVALLGVALSSLRARLALGRLLCQLGLTLAGAGLACGWWFLYNRLTYGSVAPLQSFLSRENLFAEAPTLREFVDGLPGLFLSYWAVFGWFSILVPRPYYQYFQAVVGLAALGLVVLVGRQLLWRGRGGARVAWPAVGVAAVGALSIVGAVFVYRLLVAAFHGRLLLGGITGFAVLFVLGWSAWLPRRLGVPLAVVVAATFALPAASFPWTVLRPAYAAPPVIARADVHPAQLLDRRFGAEVALRGVDLDPVAGTRLFPGDEVNLTLYLEALQPIHKDYLMFVKLLDSDQKELIGVDSHPGQGSLPTSSWQPGMVVVDRYRLRVPATAGGPAVYQIIVGFYPEDTFESLPVYGADDQPAGNSAVVATVVVPGLVDLEKSQSGLAFFEGVEPLLTLVESRPRRQDVTAGGTVDGTLVFGSVRPVSLNYTIFLHLEGPQGLLCQDDAQPRRGAFPTVFWRPGDLVQHEWHLQIPPSARPGEYQLKAGWYDLQSGRRLRTILGDSIDVGQVVVH